MPSILQSTKLDQSLLRWQCDPEIFEAESTRGIEPLESIIGQDRALKAIRLGLEVKSAGYNIYVSGMTGTGRKTTIKRFLEQIGIDGEIPGDICYVNNFKNADLPIVLYLPPGHGTQFARDIDKTIEYIRKMIPSLFESEQFKEKAKKTLEKYNLQTRDLFAELEKKINQEGFAIVRVEAGPISHPEIFPVLDGKVTNWEEIAQMVREKKIPEEQFKKLQETYNELSAKLQETLRIARKVNQDMNEAIEKLQRESVTPIVKGVISDLKLKYKDEKVQRYLDDLKQDILAHLEQFKAQPEAQQPPIPFPIPGFKPDPFLKYKVNVIVDNSGLDRVPVVIENSPSYKNLFGTIERVVDHTGVWRTDFTRIKAGSLVRANGGYLVLNLIDTLIEPGVWIALKRTLKNREVDIQSYDPFYMVSTSGMKPEPIQIDVKVVIIGDVNLYYRLFYYDEDFPKIFKVRADFDTVMPLNPGAIRDYGKFICKICSSENLLPFDKYAMAEITEYGVELAGDRKKISTKFSQIADLIREASFWAKEEKAEVVTASHVHKAIDEKLNRSRLVEDKMKEMIADGHIIIETTGQKPGQVNGLSVYQIGEHSFGLPTRITAQVGMGQSGIISVEREADLSGKTHTKGVAIISGYFRGQYA
ncbi:MAG: ATP-dependent protease, partial [Calditrichaeota bacterium]